MYNLEDKKDYATVMPVLSMRWKITPQKEVTVARMYVSPLRKNSDRREANPFSAGSFFEKGGKTLQLSISIFNMYYLFLNQASWCQTVILGIYTLGILSAILQGI